MSFRYNEIIDVDRLKHINKLSLNRYIEIYNIYKNNYKKKKELIEVFNNIKKYCNDMINHNGSLIKTYNYAFGSDYGRLFCSYSLQSLPTIVRGYLCNNYYTDIDMKNAHPTILKWICKKYNIECFQLENYVINRDRIIADNRDKLKKDFLIVMNSDKKYNGNNKFLKAFDVEMKDIQNSLYNLSDFEFIKNNNNTKNPKGSHLNKILCYYENIILQKVVSYCNNNGIQIGALCFDGLMIYGDYYENNDLLSNLNQFINTDEFSNLDIQFTYKTHNNIIFNNLTDDEKIVETNEIDIPETNEIDIPETKNIDIPELEYIYEDMVIEFEKTHAKILDCELYVCEDLNGIFKTRSAMINTYEHMIYQQYDNRTNRIVNHNFISRWITNNPDIRKYTTKGVYPPDVICPNDCYNLWKPYKMELIDNFIHDENAIEFMKNHIKILCNHEDEIYNYLCNWIGHIIQFPSQKSNCPIIIGRQGSGKTSIIHFIEHMLGSDKVYITPDPDKHIWGAFNGVIQNKIVININEINKLQAKSGIDFMKNLITEPTVTINEKGIKPYEINNSFRFIITTNNTDPFCISQDDRRFWMIYNSNELIGNNDYFNQFYNYLNDINAMKSCYEYFKNLQLLNNFATSSPPICVYHRDIIENNENPIITFFKDLVLNIPSEFAYNIINNELITQSSVLYQYYRNWCNQNGFEYVKSSPLFTKTIKAEPELSSNITTKKTNKANFIIINIEEFKNTFKLNELPDCLIPLPNDNNDILDNEI